MVYESKIIVVIVFQMFLRWNRVVALLPTPVCPRMRFTVGQMNRPPGSHPHKLRLFSKTSGCPSSADESPNLREQLLHEQLSSIGVNADGIFEAALQSIENPTAGYDGDFGKPAIRTYRTFVYPKTTHESDLAAHDQNNSISLKAAAGRTARQVDFLIKRHQTHQSEWVRHHDVIRDRRRVFPLILILDNVRSAFNVGSLDRTADATGCKAVYTCGITPHPNGSGAEKLAKSALGAELLLETKHFATTRAAIHHLRESEPDFTIVGMETTEQSKTYTEFAFDSHPKVALVLGNEVTGVDTNVFEELDCMVEIPTFGAKNSLNVAACAPVVLYEIIRQWNP